MKAIAITAHQRAEIIEVPTPDGPLAANEVSGPTLTSLVSPGTELNWAYLSKEEFPKRLGYASVFRVEEVGSGVTDLKPGALALCTANHADWQRTERQNVVPLPEGLAPEKAVFARLAGVSMSTLNTTSARPPAGVLVTGLGPVGNLAAQIFASCGYQVAAADPLESRRELARRLGLTDVRAAVEPSTEGEFMLHVECSGHEKAALDGINAVRKGGESALIGTPWQRRTEIYAAEFMRAIFFRYVSVRSGWEWQVPLHRTDFSGNSIHENFAGALRWIASGRLKVDGLGCIFEPERAQDAYQGLLKGDLPAPAVIFRWRE